MQATTKSTSPPKTAAAHVHTFTRPTSAHRSKRCPVSFVCPLCNGEATVTGTGESREFVCFDCFRYELRDRDEE